MNKAIIYFLFFLILLPGGYAAAQNKTDSLKKVIAETPDDKIRVEALISLSRTYFNDDIKLAMKYSNDAMALSEKTKYTKGVALAYKTIGNILYIQAMYTEAVNAWLKSVELFDSIKDIQNMAKTESNLGMVYFDQGDDLKALEYYFNALKMNEEINDTLGTLIVSNNIGGVYYNKKATHGKALTYYLKALNLTTSPSTASVVDGETIGTLCANIGEIYLFRYRDNPKKEASIDSENKSNLDSAFFYFNKAVKAAEGTRYLPYVLNDLGKAYVKKGEFDRAIKYQTDAYNISEKLDMRNDMAISMAGLAQTYQQKGDYKLALSAFKTAETEAIGTNANYLLKEIYEGLTAVYSELSDYGNAFRYQNLLIKIKDAIYTIEVDKKLGKLQFDVDLEKKKGEINLLTKDQELKAQEIKRQKMMRNSFIGGFAVVLLFAGVFFTQRNRISKEKKRSDELLLNILPEETAEELKQTGTAKAKSFDLVSVLFTDFKNFTQASERLSAEELVEEINHCYSEFDRIVTKYGIEKIKTIGDAYMCAGGLPAPNDTHPNDVVKAGLEMQHFIAKNKKEREEKGQPFFELRLGIHTGPVVAGIVGIKKFAYDIWGDTVNTASRMESSGQIGKVNVSGTTYDLIKDNFICTHRGKIQAKNKGEIDMYFVEGIKV